MYVALRQLKVRQPDLSILTVQPGDSVPGFDGWAHWTRKAHLDAELVRWVDGEVGKAELNLPTREVVQHFPTGPLPGTEAKAEPPLPEVFRPVQPELRSATVDEPVLTEGQAGAALAALTDSSLAPEPPAPVGPGIDGVEANLTCGLCQQTGFKNMTGLRVHKARAHKA